MIDRNTAEWILIGAMLADEDLRDLDVRHCFVGWYQRQVAESICAGNKDGLFEPFEAYLREKQSDEPLITTMFRMLRASGPLQRLRKSILKLGTGDELRLSYEEIDEVIEHLNSLTKAKV